MPRTKDITASGLFLYAVLKVAEEDLWKWPVHRPKEIQKKYYEVAKPDRIKSKDAVLKRLHRLGKGEYGFGASYVNDVNGVRFFDRYKTITERASAILALEVYKTNEEISKEDFIKKAARQGWTVEKAERTLDRWSEDDVSYLRSVNGNGSFLPGPRMVEELECLKLLSNGD